MTATVTELITEVTAVVTFLLGEFTKILELFVTEPILLLLLGMMVTGGIIGLSMRVLHRR